MRSCKRDRSQRAFAHGYTAGLRGRSRDECPHQQGERRLEWMSGWRNGRTDHHDGLNGAGLAHRLVPAGLHAI